MPSKQIIIGVDPGLANTGYGIIISEGSRLFPVNYGSIRTNKGWDFAQRLGTIFNELDSIIKKYKAEVLAVEDLYFCKNVKSALKVGQAKGVIMLAGFSNNLKTLEFTPLQIKQSVTGFGKAEKKQIQQMTKTILNLPEIPRPDHAADALAVAICASQNTNSFLH